MRKNNPRTAFSLIELSIVVLIISFIIGGIVATNRMSDNAKLTTAQSLTKNSPVADIPGLSLWLETTMPQSIAETQADNNKTVTTWYDLSPNKRNLTGSATYKTNIMNGLPVISFNGSQTFVRSTKITDLTQQNQVTIFLVQNYVSGSSSNIFWQGSGNNRMSTHAIYGVGGILYFDFGSCCTEPNARTKITPSNFENKNNIITLIKYPTIGLIAVNGSSLITSSGADGTLNDDTLGTFTVGSGFAGVMSEIIIFDRALSDTEKKDVEQYLSKKWGIAVS